MLDFLTNMQYQLDMNQYKIIKLPEPTLATKAARRSYADDKLSPNNLIAKDANAKGTIVVDSNYRLKVIYCNRFTKDQYGVFFTKITPFLKVMGSGAREIQYESVITDAVVKRKVNAVDHFTIDSCACKITLRVNTLYGLSFVNGKLQLNADPTHFQFH